MTKLPRSGLALAGLAALLMAGALPAQTVVEGRAGSATRVLIYEDLQCSDCTAFRVMMDKQILPKYGERVEFVHRDFPLAKHAWARRAAVAARFFATRDPKLGLEYRRRTLATRSETNPENFNDRVAAFAREHGIEPAEALAALNDPKYEELVEKDYQDGVGRGVVHTPTVFVNGTPFVESFTFEEISKGLDEALAQAK
jgi:protein-disulfide isomerase